ncbi:hypothetical protein B0H13DRAFT_2479586 [Mycena leptocephala]|nr:hypothetical protein B0H13DRAFT_2479586 [Mycena leptocephala]
MQASAAMTVSSSPSTRSSPVHPASLVDPSTHSPELMQLLDIYFSPPVIDYVVACVADTVDYAFGQPSAPPSELPPSRLRLQHALLRRRRARHPPRDPRLHRPRAPHLSIALAQWPASASSRGVFGTGDIGRIEREFLEVLDWELGVREGDVLALHAGLAAATLGRASARTRPDLEPSSPQSSAGSLSPRTPPSLPTRLPILSPSPVRRCLHSHPPKSQTRGTPTATVDEGSTTSSDTLPMADITSIPRSPWRSLAVGVCSTAVHTAPTLTLARMEARVPRSHLPPLSRSIRARLERVSFDLLVLRSAAPFPSIFDFFDPGTR